MRMRNLQYLTSDTGKTSLAYWHPVGRLVSCNPGCQGLGTVSHLRTQTNVIYETLASPYMSSICLECHRHTCSQPPDECHLGHPWMPHLKCSFHCCLEGFSTFLRDEGGSIDVREFL